MGGCGQWRRLALTVPRTGSVAGVAQGTTLLSNYEFVGYLHSYQKYCVTLVNKYLVGGAGGFSLGVIYIYKNLFIEFITNFFALPTVGRLWQWIQILQEGQSLWSKFRANLKRVLALYTTKRHCRS